MRVEKDEQKMLKIKAIIYELIENLRNMRSMSSTDCSIALIRRVPWKNGNVNIKFRGFHGSWGPAILPTPWCVTGFRILQFPTRAFVFGECAVEGPAVDTGKLGSR